MPDATKFQRSPNEIVDFQWQYSNRDLDYPDQCRLAQIFSGEGPAWPAEYAGKKIAADVVLRLQVADLIETSGSWPAMMSVSITELLATFVHLRSAVVRFPGWPDHVGAPPGWPTTSNAKLCIHRGTSALELLFRFAMDIDAAIIRWSGKIFALTPEGRPNSVAPTTLTDPRLDHWYRRSIDAIRFEMTRWGFVQAEQIQSEMKVVLAHLKDEVERSRRMGAPLPPADAEMAAFLAECEARRVMPDGDRAKLRAVYAYLQNPGVDVEGEPYDPPSFLAWEGARKRAKRKLSAKSADK